MKQFVKASAELGDRIRSARDAQNLTQEEMAAKLQTLGVDISRGTYAKIEAGIRHVSVEELKAIKDVLSLDYKQLFD